MKLIFLGPPYGGKGTQADLLSKKEGIPHISTGDLLREEVKKGSELGKEAETYMNKGDPVPIEITAKLLKKRLSQPDAEKGYILDGFPRSAEQAEMLEKEGIEIDYVLNYTCPDEFLIKRAGARRVCRNCGATFNIIYHQPKQEGVCDKCGGELYIRDDDKEEIIKNRLKVYKEQTAPLIDYYEKKGKLINVDGSKSIQEVFDATVEALEKAGQ
jgi:adenylate kinase